LDGVEACSGGLVFASEMLVSTILTVVAMCATVQQAMNRQQDFDEYGELANWC